VTFMFDLLDEAKRLVLSIPDLTGKEFNTLAELVNAANRELGKQMGIDDLNLPLEFALENAHEFAQYFYRQKNKDAFREIIRLGNTDAFCNSNGEVYPLFETVLTDEDGFWGDKIILVLIEEDFPDFSWNVLLKETLRCLPLVHPLSRYPYLSAIVAKIYSVDVERLDTVNLAYFYCAFTATFVNPRSPLFRAFVISYKKATKAKAPELSAIKTDEYEIYERMVDCVSDSSPLKFASLREKWHEKAQRNREEHGSYDCAEEKWVITRV